ncbi:phage terminase large subunit family protein [Fuscibacter oryzae]|uniref:Phage terminase large subunit family protein n=1 Tax=Fuscibacter oryzae TaxID=2803939 RepID=A0A8J7STM2_9RHOB|nr:phage terminase large subunit family protein [Fuscibacter oryzae]MBL4929346.1 phage terminase large subunit family protein [Fuscibacter oryzae]
MSLPFGNLETIWAAVATAQRHLMPPPDLLPSEYAAQNVVIPVGNARPGLINFDNAPYQREPLDMTVNPACRRITMQWGAQVGKTTVALCAQAYRIQHNPTNQMMMQPSQGDLKTWLETKFNPLVEANDELSQLIAPPRGRRGVNNDLMKSYPGGFIMFAWSGSPKTMRGRSAPFAVCDETDGYDRTAEGHPVSLLAQRLASFEGQSLLLEISTPLIRGSSHIETAFELGDQRRFNVPCPHCGHRQTLRWDRVTWSQDASGNHRPDTAGYECEAEGCGTIWTDVDRIAAIRAGEWVAAKPFDGHASYHLNELYSCFRKLESIVRSFLEKKAAGDLQTFVNVSLAETWEEAAEQISSGDMMARVEIFRAPVPARALFLTAGIDMQQDRLEVEIVAWGLGEESWSIRYEVLWGDPMRDEVWEALDDLLATTYLHQSGAQLPISGACLDTGGSPGMTQAAYEYARGKTSRRLFAIKGVGGWGRPVVSAPSRKRTGRGQRKVDLFTVGADEAKLVVMRRWGLLTPGPGYCHFPKERDPEWFAQATAEALVTRHVRGFAVREWHKKRDRNEALDCRVYAYAALKILNPNMVRLSDRLKVEDDQDDEEVDDLPDDRPMAAIANTAVKLHHALTALSAAGEEAKNAPEEHPPEKPQVKASATPPKRRRRKSGWMTNW